MKAIAIVSGGMDSTTLAYRYADQGTQLVIVSVDYGQRHRRELLCAAKSADALGAEHIVVDLRDVGCHLSGSALTDSSVDVPEGHYAADVMKATVVPNRNAILLNVAIGIAVSRKADLVGTAVHAGDHVIYPDCRPAFIEGMSALALVANEGFISPEFRVDAPYVNLTKADIAAEGDKLGVPWAETWSCYRGETLHCGKCGTCVERIEAFDLAGVDDPTEYAP